MADIIRLQWRRMTSRMSLIIWVELQFCVTSRAAFRSSGVFVLFLRAWKLIVRVHVSCRLNGFLISRYAVIKVIILRCLFEVCSESYQACCSDFAGHFPRFRSVDFNSAVRNLHSVKQLATQLIWAVKCTRHGRDSGWLSKHAALLFILQYYCQLVKYKLTYASHTKA